MTTTATPPQWKHQTDALNFVRDLPGAMIAMEMGCGKSRCAIDLLEEIQAHRTLIICPLSIVDHVWPEQIETYSQRKLRVVPLGTRYQSVKDKLEAATNLLAPTTIPAVLIVNIESCWRPPLASWLMNQKWDLLIVDESHRLKTPAGKASLYVSRLADRVPRRLALTGTPMPNSPLDIYAQYRIVDKSIYGTNNQAFKDRYSITSEMLVRKNVPQQQGSDPSNTEQEFMTISKVTDFKDLDHLEELFHSRAFRVTADEVLDLPPAMKTYYKVPLGPKAQTNYLQMEKEFIAQLQNGDILTAPNALAKLLRLQQITSGYAPTKDGGTIQIDQSKTNALRDLLTDIPPEEPVVVFARFHHDLEEIIKTAQACDRPALELSGRTKQIQEWKEQGGVLAVQIQTGGLGISLTQARYCIYYSLGFNLADYLQSMARVHRPGQTRPVQYIHIVAQNTIDITVINSLARKQDVVASILEKKHIDRETLPPQEGRHAEQTASNAQTPTGQRPKPRFWITNPPPPSEG